MKVFFKFTIVLLTINLIQFSLKAQDTLDYEQIEKSVDKYLKYFSDENPGAVVSVVLKGESVFSKAYGMSDITTKEIMNEDKAFNLGELSKAFTAVAILKLVEKNKLRLQDNLTDIFPYFPDYGKNITVQNMLDHKSGLPNYNPDKIKTNDELLKYLKLQENTDFEPGSKMKFSNSDYALLVKIIEKSSKKSYQAYLRKTIFKKSKMMNTFFANEIEGKNIARAHFKENGKYIEKSELNFVYGNQGIYSNSGDMIKWGKAQNSKKILKSESLNKIFRIGKLNGGESISDYSCGWALMAKNGVRYFWQGASQGGYSDLILRLPDNKTTVIILTNRNDGYDFLKMAIYIARLFDKELKLFDKEL